MEKTVIGRKEYTCALCLGVLRKGQRHTHHKYKSPTYDGDDNQVGFEYGELRFHQHDCFPKILYSNDPKKAMRECNNGIHDFKPDPNPDSTDSSKHCHTCGFKEVTA